LKNVFEDPLYANLVVLVSSGINTTTMIEKFRKFDISDKSKINLANANQILRKISWEYYCNKCKGIGQFQKDKECKKHNSINVRNINRILSTLRYGKEDEYFVISSMIADELVKKLIDYLEEISKELDNYIFNFGAKGKSDLIKSYLYQQQKFGFILHHKLNAKDSILYNYDKKSLDERFKLISKELKNMIKYLQQLHPNIKNILQGWFNDYLGSCLPMLLVNKYVSLHQHMENFIHSNFYIYSSRDYQEHLREIIKLAGIPHNSPIPKHIDYLFKICFTIMIVKNASYTYNASLRGLLSTLFTRVQLYNKAIKFKEVMPQAVKKAQQG